MILLHAQLEAKFQIRNFQRLEPGKPLTYIGMRVSAASDGSGRIHLDSADYIQQVLKKQNMLLCNPVKVPMDRTLLKEAAASPLILDKERKMAIRKVHGKLSWLNTTTCPGIAVATSKCKSFDSAPKEGCDKLIHQVARYLKGAQFKAIASNPDSEVGLVVEVDSDYCGDYAVTGSTKSTLAIKITLKGMLVYWSSKKQTTVADSSGRAELNALASGLREGLHLMHISEELGILPAGSRLRVYCDSNAALGFSENNGNTTQMKHVDIRQDWVRECRDRTESDLFRVDGKCDGADHFSKIMGRAEFERTSKGNTIELSVEMRYVV